MMFKSSITTFLLLATLAILASAQEVPATTTPSLTATPTTNSAATGGPTNTATGPAGNTTVTGVPKPPPTNPLTAVPDFTSLASAIASLATGRAQNPGFSPTAKPGGANGASRLGGASDVMTGLVMVVLSAVVAGAGTLAL
ncbi:hypothetical protein BGZ95_000787 [Linnemannia exigua]|uniref:Uncharacterized protein n=1 Tax=Linnemannia exigua TaxID=604196 RepID=A0AAD4DJ71_9FUNG|nr:hypothetical protein BGZ95_000787 [Linnemannia exigua]